MTTETITWIQEADKPDSDVTVLLHDPNASEPVWPGYWGGDQWRFIDGMPANPIEWARMPGGSKR